MRTEQPWNMDLLLTGLENQGGEDEIFCKGTFHNAVCCYRSYVYTSEYKLLGRAAALLSSCWKEDA